jgi:hypothetical protein
VSDAPLTPLEETQAADLRTWIVWYEDLFSHDPAFPVSVHLNEQDAAGEAARRGGPPPENGDGYVVTRPGTLLEDYRRNLISARAARELLLKAVSGEPGIRVPL